MEEQKEVNLTSEEEREQEYKDGTEFTITESLNNVTLEVPAKKKRKGLIALVAILIIVVFAGGCVLIFGPKRIVNTFYHTFTSNSTYYAWVEKNNASHLLSAMITSEAKDGGYEADFNLSLNANITSFLSASIDTLGIKISSQQKQQQIQTDYVLSYGENSVMDITTLIDKGNKGFYVQFPELSEQFLTVDFDDEISFVSLLSAGEAPKLISKYLKNTIDAIDLSVKMEKSQEFTLGELTIKGTKIVATYPVSEAMKELSNQFAIMKADDDMFQVLSEVGIKKSEYESLMESLSTQAKDLSSSISEDEVVTMTCYVNEDGMIVGRVIELEVEATEYKLSLLINSKNRIAGELLVGGLSMVTLDGSFQTNKEVGEIITIKEDNVESANEYAEHIGKDSIDEYVNTIIDRLGLLSYGSSQGDSVTSGGDLEIGNTTTEEGTFEFTLGEYTGISVQKPNIEITEEEVQEEIKAFVEYYSEMIPVTDRDIVNDGDYVNIDYVGTIDGVEFSGGSATGSELGIGTDTFIDGFEDQLIGAKVGDTVIVKVTFPDTYGSADVAGKDAEFTVTVNAIGIREFSDEFVAHNTEFTTTEEYEEYVYQGLVETKEYDMQSAMDEEIITQVVANTTFTSVNQSEIDAKESELLSTYEYYANYYGVDLEQFAATGFGMSIEEFYEEIKYYADLYVKESYVLAEIAKLEGIQLTEEEYQERLQEINLQYGYESVEELEAAIGGRKALEKLIIEEKTIEFLRSISNIYE